MKTEKFKVTPLERAWILYDVGNSAFVLMIATLVPIFFNALAEAGGVSKVDYLAYWGYASSIVTVVTAILGPILGTLADTKGFKKPIFMLCLFVGVIGCCAMGLAGTWLAFLVIFIIAKIGYSGSLVFYDSMLGDVTTPERMDMVSSRGYAWGYIGSCVPFVVCLALVLGSSVVGLSQMTALSIALVITAVWWLAVTLPLLKKYRQINYVEVEQHAIRQSFVRIGQTLKHLPQDKQVFWFLLAFFCYIDGVYTIIDMATAYGTALGLDTTGLLLALLVTQIVAFPSALIFGRLSQKYASKTLIPVCIAAYTGIAVFAFFLKSQWQFWVLAVVVGILLCRGVPVLLAEHFFDTRSGLTTRAQKAQLALYSAAGLPIIVAVTEVATSSDLLEESTASLLVAGGALTVLLFPLWALGIRQAFGSGQPIQQEPSRKEQMNALKAQRNAQAKLATGMIPVVRLKSQPGSEPQLDSETQPESESPADAQPGSAEATGASAGSSVASRAASRAEAKKRSKEA